MDVLVTATAVEVLKALNGGARAAVTKFLKTHLAQYTSQHQPQKIRGLSGDVWVVRSPGSGDVDPAELPTLVITRDANRKDTYVVTAAFLTAPDLVPEIRGEAPIDPASVGFEVMRAAAF